MLLKIGLANLNGTKIYEGKNSNASENLAIARSLNAVGLDCDVLSDGFKNKESSNTQKSVNLFDFAQITTSTSDDSNQRNKIRDYNVTDPKIYDILLIMNAGMDFYGGEMQKSNGKIMEFICNTREDCKIFYLMNDISLPFVQVGHKFISKKMYIGIYDPQDYIIKKPITILTDFSDHAHVRRLNTNSLSKHQIEDIITLPTSKLILENPDWRSLEVKNTNEFDLIYGGSFRSGKRADVMYEYFIKTCGELNNAFYGSLKEKHFEKFLKPDDNIPVLLGKVPSNEVIKNNARGIASVLMTEKGYTDFVTRRVIETMLGNCVMFYDEKFTRYDVMVDKDFQIVSSGEELVKKVKELKTNQELRDKIIKGQFEILENMAVAPTYGENFKKILKSKNII